MTTRFHFSGAVGIAPASDAEARFFSHGLGVDAATAKKMLARQRAAAANPTPKPTPRPEPTVEIDQKALGDQLRTWRATREGKALGAKHNRDPWALAKEIGIAVTFTDAINHPLWGPALGQLWPAGVGGPEPLIVIARGQSGAESLRTLAHELAHFLLSTTDEAAANAFMDAFMGVES